MHVYAYNNPNHNMDQLSRNVIPINEFEGRCFDDVLNVPDDDSFNTPKNSIVILSSSGYHDLKDFVKADDVLITSTLTNFSLDFINALNIVADLDSINVRVISIMEEFDSYNNIGRVLLASLVMMHKFRRNSYAARKASRLAGIEKAAAEGKYKGRQAFSPADFPNFADLYRNYMRRELGKGEFAEKLGVSRPTLDRLIDEFKRRKKGD